ncbi:hypothetical protein B5F33_10055 [Collinsella sp. An2]|nr:hypothetical protein B5F33_10055 [Collinsella sp. An2]
MVDAKRALRRRLRAERSNMDAAERARIDEAIARRVEATEVYRGATVVCTYLSFGAEVETRGIIRAAWRANKVVALPRVVGPAMLRWYCIDSFDGLEKGAFGTQEPVPESGRELCLPTVPGDAAIRVAETDVQDIQGRLAEHRVSDAACRLPSVYDARYVAIVPGLAFDRRGYRLGYGGGYYDAFLRSFPGVSVGLCRSAALFEDLGDLGALEPHDVPVDVVVTEQGQL